MSPQSTGIRLLRLAAIALLFACGRSDLLLDQGDGLALQDADVSGSDSAAAAPTGSSTSTAPGSTGAPGNSVPPANTTPPGMTTPPGTVALDAGCSTNLLASEPGARFASCWSCVTSGCESQLTACNADCTCDSAIAGSFACVSGGGDPIGCFFPALSTGDDPAIIAAANCLIMAGGDCGCQSDAGNASPPDAGNDGSAACVMNGGTAGSGNGECTSTLKETCGDTQYQVVCACPQASCACFGPSTQVISFDGCPYCPTPGGGGPGTTTSDDLFTRCGFPH